MQPQPCHSHKCRSVTNAKRSDQIFGRSIKYRFYFLNSVEWREWKISFHIFNANNLFSMFTNKNLIFKWEICLQRVRYTSFAVRIILHWMESNHALKSCEPFLLPEFCLKLTVIYEPRFCLDEHPTKHFYTIFSVVHIITSKWRTYVTNARHWP